MKIIFFVVLNIEYQCPKLKCALHKTEIITAFIVDIMNKKKPTEIKNEISKELEREIEKLFEGLPREDPIVKLKENDQNSQIEKNNILRETANNIFKTLTAREERLMRMYFGFGLNHSYKVHEIARQFDLSENDIRKQLTTAFRRFLKGYFLQINFRSKYI